MYACKLCALPAVLVRLLICLDNVSLYVSSYVRACTAANYPYLLPCLCVYLHIVLCPFPMCMCTCMCMCACMCMCMCMCPCPFSVAPFTPPCPIPLVCANLKASPSSPCPPPSLPSPPHPDLRLPCLCLLVYRIACRPYMSPNVSAWCVLICVYMYSCKLSTACRLCLSPDMSSSMGPYMLPHVCVHVRLQTMRIACRACASPYLSC